MIPRFCIQNRITDREATPCTVAQLLEVMSSEHVQTICDEIKLLQTSSGSPRRGEVETPSDDIKEEMARLKRQLPVITPHARAFKDNIRKNANAIESGLVMLDVDHVEHPSMETLALTPEVCQANRIYYVGITPSGHGLRVIGERLKAKGEGMESIAEAQERLARLCRVVEYDAQTKDLARASFLVPRSYVLYMDEEGLSTEPSPEVNEEVNIDRCAHLEALEGGSDPKGRAIAPGRKGETAMGREGETAGQSPIGREGETAGQSPIGREGERTYQGLPYSDIISQLVMLLGGEPEVGARNTFYFTLVMYSRYICDFQSDILLAVLPDFGLSEAERRGVINSAVNRPRKATVPDMVTRAIAMAQAVAPSDSPCRGEVSEWVVDQEALPMPKLPKVLSLICKRLPEEFRPAMVIAALPVLGTLATRVRFRYLDHQEHSFSFMSCITAPAATGKSFIRRPINLLLTPIDEQDEIEREKEQEYKEKLRVAKNAKVQPENPRACPRNNGINISIAKLLQLLSYSEGKHLIGIGEEIDTLVKSERAGVWSQKSDIYRLGFDNAKYGQNYMSDNSFSANVPVYYNLLLTGTPGGMYRFFKDVEDGLVTRFAFAQLPDMFGTDIPDFQPYTQSEENEIIRIARTLDMASGTIYCSAVDEAISQWLQDKKQAAIAADSRAIDTIRKRAAVMGFRAGYLAALLNGSAKKNAECKMHGQRPNSKLSAKSATTTSSEADAAAFGLWVAEYIFQNQMQLFGDKFEQVANDWETQQGRRGTVRNLLMKLPTTFTRADLMSLRAKNGQTTEIRYVLSRWIEANLIVKNADGSYCKIM